MLHMVTIFIGAFLLFQVQPLIAKLILPLFGGGAAIWTACLLFFQGALLCGYFYSHYLTKLKTIRHQVIVHLVLLCISLVFLPIGLIVTLDEQQSASPLTNIIIILTMSVGLPYLLLSSTGPLVQRWLSYQVQNLLPYKLYSLSNVGSLLALLSYPFLFEPLLTLTAQTLSWSIGYTLYVLCIAALCITMYKQNINIALKPVLSDDSADHNVTVNKSTQMALWLMLSAIGVVLLVSVTNAMTQNIPPVPFLWILPLCIYLMTFIINFHSPRWYVRWYWFVLLIISAIAAMLMFFIGSYFDIISQIAIYSVILLSGCMICHGELAQLKPEVERLTLYYLVISLGGFLGSVFVAFVAQNVFTSFYEFPLAIVCLFFLFCGCILWHKYSPNKESGEPSAVLMFRSSLVMALLLAGFFSYLNVLFSERDVINKRNFYGILSVKDISINGRMERRLIDGTTSHGTQALDEKYSNNPMSYYRKNTGVALALEHEYSQLSIKVGFVGLGAGTLAAYGQKGDDFTFYEINPDVERLANSHFTYLKNSKASIRVKLGDARVTLSQELAKSGSQQYQVLVIDAFAGDSIPVHLLTKEAFELYWQHLNASGVLAIHISNSHLDLKPLVQGLALSVGKQALYFETKATSAEVNNTAWVIVTNNEHFMSSPKTKQFVTAWPSKMKNIPVWSDDYSNLLSVLK